MPVIELQFGRSSRVTRRWIPLVAALFYTGSALTAAAAERAVVDAATGLAVDEHFELVRANCTVCHSPKIITQTRLSRDEWRATLRWMQATQGLWSFPAATEKQILDYLSRHYGPGDRALRRKPLPPNLRPPTREAVARAKPGAADSRASSGG